MRLIICGALSLAMLASVARAQPTDPNPRAPLPADTPSLAPSGATFTAPKSWTVSSRPSLVVLTAPEGDANLVLADVPQAADARAAVDAAWRLYNPPTQHPFKLMTARPPRNGWDEREVLDYETSPNEHVVVEALAFRSGGHWTVALLEGSQATVEKRAAAGQLIIQSLRPKGYQRENFAGRPAHALDRDRLTALEDFVRTSIGQLGVPGAAVALIDHGAVVFEGGFGVRERGKPQPVDAHTLFMIASNTKGMSTLLLAKLVDQGKLTWDEPVTRVYPSFRLGSPDTTRKVLVRHLVCACTGLPRKDFDWIFDTRPDTPASATFDELAATQPTSGFGEVFQYNNLMAAAAGYLGGHLVNPDLELGAAYDAAMQKEIFDPIGMGDTTFAMARALSGDHASPHGDDIDGRPSLANMDFNYMVEPYRPAGGAWSSAHDLIRYVGDELDQGKLPDGRRLVSAQNLLVRRAPGVATGEDAYYGMGLEGDRTWGVLVIHHGGSMAGFKSDIIFIPDAGVGAVILTNADDGGYLLRPFMRRLLELLYDGNPEAAGDVAAAAARNQAEIAKERQRLVYPASPALAADLAGGYVSPELGRITVRREGGQVVFDFGAWRSRVASRRNDDGTISFVTVDPATSGFEFVVATRSGKRALVIRDGQHEYVYTEAV
jgi:CubicO group peptidase (beta-lactamase class C family)